MLDQIAKVIVRDLFILGSEPNRPTTRIEFKHKPVDGKEISQGGLCRSSLEAQIAQSLKDQFGA